MNIEFIGNKNTFEMLICLRDNTISWIIFPTIFLSIFLDYYSFYFSPSCYFYLTTYFWFIWTVTFYVFLNKAHCNYNFYYTNEYSNTSTKQLIMLKLFFCTVAIICLAPKQKLVVQWLYWLKKLLYKNPQIIL